jgi:hypothetical protein
MGGLRTVSTGRGVFAPFWLSALCGAFAPSAIGYQDLAAFLARQPGVSERWREHLIASPFGTIHAATFNFSRPIGTAMPQPAGFQRVNFDPASLDVKTWSAATPTLDRPAVEIAYPTVNRVHKGDRLPPPPQAAPPASAPASLPQLQPVSAPPVPQHSPPMTSPRPKDADAGQAASPAVPNEQTGAIKANVEDDTAFVDRPSPILESNDSEPLEAAPSSFDQPSFLNADPAERNAQLYFGVSAMGASAGLEQWGAGAAPVLVSAHADPVLEADLAKDDASRVQSPAERLGLAGRARAKAEKCLADAVYFEARGEPLRGQKAVAQVVMNRVFSGYYPNNVCGVVYQNANRHLACQFTFACEGKDLSRIDEPDMWEQAKHIAKDALDGKIWLPEVGHATHYHAYWVHPSWVHEMAKLYKLGVHTFYRPRAWGDGSDAPIWSAVPTANKNGSAPDAAKVPQAAASPADTSGKNAKTAKL